MDGTARASPHRGRAESRLGRLRCRDGRAARLGKTLRDRQEPLESRVSKGCCLAMGSGSPLVRSHCATSGHKVRRAGVSCAETPACPDKEQGRAPKRVRNADLVQRSRRRS